MSTKSAIPNNICVAIPAYNAGQSLPPLIDKIKSLYNFKKEQVIVVNDGSNDNTGKCVKNQPLTIIEHRKNRGKGAGILTAARFAVKMDFEAIIFIDADGQHPPEYIARFIKMYAEDRPDMIIGKRKLDKNMPLTRKTSNFFGILILGLLLKRKVHDTQSGFRLVKLPFMEKFTYKGSRYELETEILIKFFRNNARIKYLDIPTIYNKMGSHYRLFSDLMRFFYIIFYTVC